MKVESKGLNRLRFLLGSWEGTYRDEFGEKGILKTEMHCTWQLEDRFLQIVGKTTKEGRVINEGIQFITYDNSRNRYVSKRLWSYGFIENGDGWWDDDKTLMFDISIDNPPPDFSGTRWRSFIRQYSPNEIGTGLLAAAKGEDFKRYGESRAQRVA